MKFDDNGVYVELGNGEERMVPWHVYNKVLKVTKEIKDEMNNIPKVIRFFVKKAMKGISSEDYACDSISHLIRGIEDLGGTIKWKTTKKEIKNG